MIKATILLNEAMDLLKRVLTEGDSRGQPRCLYMASSTLAETRDRVGAQAADWDWRSQLAELRLLTGVPIEPDEAVEPGMVRVEWP